MSPLRPKKADRSASNTKAKTDPSPSNEVLTALHCAQRETPNTVPDLGPFLLWLPNRTPLQKWLCLEQFWASLTCPPWHLGTHSSPCSALPHPLPPVCTLALHLTSLVTLL